MADERIGKVCGACGWVVRQDAGGVVRLCMHDPSFLGLELEPLDSARAFGHVAGSMASLDALHNELRRALCLVDRVVCHALRVEATDGETILLRCSCPGGHAGDHDFTPVDLRAFMAAHLPDVLAHVEHIEQRIRELERLLCRDRWPPVPGAPDFITETWLRYGDCASPRAPGS